MDENHMADATNPYEAAMECVVSGVPAEEVAEVLAESDTSASALEAASETTFLSYLMKMEEFFDTVDLYAFDGWIDAEIVGYPILERFWVTVTMTVPKKTELVGGLRIVGKDRENSVKIKKLTGGYQVRMKILRRVLDQIEMNNKQSAAQGIADK